MTETKEVTKVEPTSNAMVVDGDYGASNNISAEDCERGRIAVMQGLSELVKQGKAKFN
jgi:hypothetical protein